LKENFKLFVRSNPKLITYVKNKNATWQELFEIYSLYGEDKEVWDKYIINDNSINDLISLIKNVNLDSIKNIVDGMQKAISIIQSISSNNNEPHEEYEAKKKYDNLDD